MPNKEESDEICEVEEDHPSVTTSDLNEMDKQPSLERVQHSNSDDFNQPNDSTKQLQSGNDIKQPTEKPQQQAPPPPSVIVAPIPVVFQEEGLEDNVKPDSNTPTNPDQCCYFLCCGYPNGACQIFMAQFFLAVGLMLCGWAMIDCRFIEATAGFPELYYPEDVTPPQENSPFIPTDQRRGFGLYLNETTNGGCFSDRESRYWVLEEIENYIDFLGSDWELPRFLASIAVSIGWLAWFVLAIFVFCSCVKVMRFLMAAFLFLLVAGFQSSAFSVLGSDFCNTEGANCEPARGFWIMVAGIACYAIASLMLALTKDYPGR